MELAGYMRILTSFHIINFQVTQRLEQTGLSPRSGTQRVRVTSEDVAQA